MNGLETYVLSYLMGIASAMTPIIAHKLTGYLRITRPMKQMWKNYISRQTYGVLSCSESVVDLDSYSTGLFDTLALSEIRELLSSFPNTRLYPFSCRRYPPYLNANSIVLFGGPISNSLVKIIMVEKKKTVLEFDDHTIVDRKNNKRFEPEVRDDRVVKDFGLVVRMKSPFNSQLDLMIVAGCFDYGTFLSARALIDPGSVKEILRTVGEGYFEIVVSGDVVDGTPQTPVIEYCIVRTEA